MITHCKPLYVLVFFGSDYFGLKFFKVVEAIIFGVRYQGDDLVFSGAVALV